jgi:hypothetical protein
MVSLKIINFSLLRMSPRKTMSAGRDIAAYETSQPIILCNFNHALSQSHTGKDGVYFITFTCPYLVYVARLLQQSTFYIPSLYQVR